MRNKTRIAGAFLLAWSLAGCGGGATAEPSSSAAAVPSASPPVGASFASPVSPAPSDAPTEVGSLGPFPPGACPVPDADVCTAAADLAQAILDGDNATIVGLSRADTFACSELDAAIFTGCETADVLEGHPIGAAGGAIEVHTPEAYLRELDALETSIEPSFTDDLGDGRARVLGTSACGPEDPARRSYYVAWMAAAARGGAAAAERIVGLYEFTFRDDGWRIGIAYIGNLADWEIGADRLVDDLACGVTPWPAG